MNRLPEILTDVHMYLKETNLPARGKALGWSIVVFVCAVSFWIIFDALSKF